jgi:chromate transporter|uniref:chromate efflux transporter n=1 Tax=Cephaloticoccus sp. TaxID=1985742 RepID=UPI00404A6DD2
MGLNKPTLREAWRFWLKLGLISFGGPAGQIAIMHRELVDRKKWIEESRFLHALNFCMLLPGPEATQLATYCGWLLHGIRGALTAGLLFILPAIGLLWGLSWVYMVYGTLPAVAAIFHGLKAAVLAIVVVALCRVARRALKTTVAWILATMAFVGLYLFQLPFPFIVFGTLLVGFVGGRIWPRQFGVANQPVADALEPAMPVNPYTTLKIVLVGGVLWFAPVLIAGLSQGWQGTLAQQGWFFSKAAVVTFGGAYAVLPYVAQQAVENYHWLSPAQMLDGLGLAETTPGPLIMVLQFVGFTGGWQQPGAMSQLGAATLSALMTTWVTFVPTYLFILVGAPYVERLRSDARLSAALAAVTAAVVGVILNLAVWFGHHVFLPMSGSIDWFAVVVCAAGFAAMQWAKWEVIPVVISGGVLGLLWGWLA